MEYHINQPIFFLNREDKRLYTKHFNWLFRAIKSTSDKYITYSLPYDSKEKKQTMYHLERVFAYELYRQWANILDNECKENVCLNAELNKLISKTISYKDEKKEYLTKYPDLVLHGGQGNHKKQRIICEIKRNKSNKDSGDILANTLIFADLFKLTCYIDKQEFASPFDFGVFILLNGELSQISKLSGKIRIGGSNKMTFKQFVDTYSKFFSKIVCITYDGKNLEYDVLSSLLQGLSEGNLRDKDKKTGKK